MSKCVVNRKALIEALDHIKHTVASYCVKEVLKCVHMTAANGWLVMQATDLELELLIRIPAEGDLAPCFVNADKLATRVKAGKHETCALEVQGTGETNKNDRGDWESYSLIANGGKVSHKIPGECLHDFFLIPTPTTPVGHLTISGQEIIDLLPIALVGIAKETTRYAINGVLLEAGKRNKLIGTDGRRMVCVDLKTVRTKAKQLAMILDEKTCVMLKRLLGKKSQETIAVSLNDFVYEDADPTGSKARPEQTMTIAGENWTLKASPNEGRFPCYDDVWPKENLNEWRVNLSELQDVFAEVAVAVTEDKGAVLAFSPDKVRLTAGVEWNGESEGEVAAEFVDGLENAIVTCANPVFIRDALKTLDTAVIRFRLVQNRVGFGEKDVVGYPVQMIGSRVSWLVMPMHMGVSITAETVGARNYAGYLAKTGVAAPEPVLV